MPIAQRRLAVHTSKRHPLRTALLVVALIAVAAAYFGGLEIAETGFDLSWLTEGIFG